MSRNSACPKRTELTFNEMGAFGWEEFWEEEQEFSCECLKFEISIRHPREGVIKLFDKNLVSGKIEARDKNTGVLNKWLIFRVMRLDEIIKRI